ncbi:hypothetical protein C7974DRAFT_467430, partial [Boeremia exigua]|uniref:uncharacterized protein n=1 Tax=Boeremia exigua TaxID=749465 RepID=UPI001E8D0649
MSRMGSRSYSIRSCLVHIPGHSGASHSDFRIWPTPKSGLIPATTSKTEVCLSLLLLGAAGFLQRALIFSRSLPNPTCLRQANPRHRNFPQPFTNTVSFRYLAKVKLVL